MTDATKQKFLVLYLIPASVVADWAKTDPTIRQPEEQKMQAAWGKWMGEHANPARLTEVEFTGFLTTSFERRWTFHGTERFTRAYPMPTRWKAAELMARCDDLIKG